MSAGVSEGAFQNEWLVRPAYVDDAEAIVNLLNQVYGHWGDLDHWRWKYEQPPASFRLPSAVAELDGQIVGHFGIVPLASVIDGEPVLGAQTVDAAVLPAYRRRGIHTSLGRFVLDQAAQVGAIFIYAFPGLLSLAVDQRIGYRSVAFLPEMVRVLQPGQALRRFLRFLPADLCALCTAYRKATWSPDVVQRVVRLRRSLLLLASWSIDPVVAWSAQHRLLMDTNFNLLSVDGFDERFDRLWDQVREHIDLGVCKDVSYLNWRYRLNPSGKYEVIVAERCGELIGFLVVRHAGLHSGITDLLVLPDCLDAVSGLVLAAIAQARRMGSIILTAWVPAEHPYHAGLRQIGFVSQRRLHWLADRWPVLARWLYQVIVYAEHLPCAQQAQLVTCARTWSLAMGDSDLV